MIFNKVIRKMNLDEQNIYYIEYDVLSIKDDIVKLQKKRQYNDFFNHIVNPQDENELDVFIEYPLLYVINNFKPEDNWNIFKTETNKDDMVKGLLYDYNFTVDGVMHCDIYTEQEKIKKCDEISFGVINQIKKIYNIR